MAWLQEDHVPPLQTGTPFSVHVGFPARHGRTCADAGAALRRAAVPARSPASPWEGGGGPWGHLGAPGMSIAVGNLCRQQKKEGR